MEIVQHQATSSRLCTNENSQKGSNNGLVSKNILDIKGYTPQSFFFQRVESSFHLTGFRFRRLLGLVMCGYPSQDTIVAEGFGWDFF